jgi:CDP-6-deoxy-D-xylo-4-hexulose-3-dehydrase
MNERIPYSGRVYDNREIENLCKAAEEFWLTAGHWTAEFEKKLADYLGLPFCLFVNSGSSANLLAFMALTSPLLGNRAVKRGDEVITVAAGFPTTIAPIIQFGAIPVFVDIAIPQYNINVSQLESVLSEKTRAVIVAHTLGNPFDILTVKKFCDKNALWLIEDNCDALGSEYTLGTETRKTGTFGDIGTSSFYPPHHITTGEGGAVYTKEPLLYKIMHSMRDWGRDCICESGVDNKCGKRFSRQFGELPFGYDHKYVYSHFGYNLKATDLQAAIGVAQLDKLPDFVEKRRDNWNFLRKKLEHLQDELILPEALPNSKPSWFGFAISSKQGRNRKKIIEHLESQNIQTRMLFAGNIIKHPCFDEMRKTGEGYRVAGNLEGTNFVMENMFWVGVYPGLDEGKLLKIANEIEKILS